MAERRERGQATPEGEELEARGAIVKVQSLLAEKNLFESLGIQVADDVRVIEKILENLGAKTEIRSHPTEIAALVHYLMANYVGTSLGYIIHPVHGKEIILDRIAQIAGVLEMIVEKRIDSLIQMVRRGQLPPDHDIARDIDNIIRMQEVSMLALREVINRLLTLLQINAPAWARPPLANVKMGYEII